ncbi:MAG TPA: AbrB/MazE/SpoVT family DNA-binding domain-containing protein [Candidatus Kryptonia bacterium]|nr:AbrB/MazE/SpoVT family DNA-binding domain-containing protein [Candidatus Kryptonia bacterium]
MTAKPITEVVKVGRRGELALSRRVRAALALNEGDELVLSVEEDQLVLRRKARRFHEYLDTLAPKATP